MTVKLFPAFTLTSAQPFSCSIWDGSISSGSQVRITGSYFLCFSGSVLGTQYLDFTRTLDTVLNGIDSETWFATYDGSTRRFKIGLSAESGHRLTMSMGNETSKRLIGADEMRSVNTGVSESMTSQRSPYHQFTSQYPERSNWSDRQEGFTRWVEAYADDGTPYAIGRTASPIFEDWEFQYEPVANVYNYASGSTNPYTWETFINYVGANIPWALVSGTIGNISASQVQGAYRMRAEGARLQPRSGQANWHASYHLPVMAQRLSSSF